MHTHSRPTRSANDAGNPRGGASTGNPAEGLRAAACFIALSVFLLCVSRPAAAQTPTGCSASFLYDQSDYGFDNGLWRTRVVMAVINTNAEACTFDGMIVWFDPTHSFSDMEGEPIYGLEFSGPVSFLMYGSDPLPVFSDNLLVRYMCSGLQCNPNPPTSAPTSAPTPPAAVRVGFTGSVSGCSAVEAAASPFLRAPTWVTSYPRPQVVMSFDSVEQLLQIRVRVPFSPQYTKYILGFAPFEGEWTPTNPSRPFVQPTDGSNIGPFFGDEPDFANWWLHPSNSLGLDGYPARGSYVQGAYWRMYADGCGHMLYVATMSMAQMSTFRSNSASNYRLISYTTNAGATTASGTLYISMVSPTSLADGPSAGYSYAQWPVPFNVHIDTGSTSVVTSPYGAVVQVLFTTATLMPDNTLRLVLQTMEQTRGGSLSYGALSLANATGPVELTLSSVSPAAPQLSPARQTFVFLSTAVPGDGVYTGTYTFTLTAYECGEGDFPYVCPISGPVTVSVYIDLRATPAVDYWTSYATSISLWTSDTFDEGLGEVPLLDGTQVCARDYVFSPGFDNNNNGFITGLDIREVYLCSSSTPGGQVVYDGTSNFGCLDSADATKIVGSGAVIHSAFADDFYGTTLYQGLTAQTSGVCFSARTQILNTASNELTTPVSAQYVHIRATVTLNTGARKRDAHASSTNQSRDFVAPMTAFFNVIAASSTTGTGSGTGTGTGTGPTAPAPGSPAAAPGADKAAIAIGVSTFGAAILAAIVVCCCRSRMTPPYGAGDCDDKVLLENGQTVCRDSSKRV